jgi:hypothetical protein
MDKEETLPRNIAAVSSSVGVGKSNAEKVERIVLVDGGGDINDGRDRHVTNTALSILSDV